MLLALGLAVVLGGACGDDDEEEIATSMGTTPTSTSQGSSSGSSGGGSTNAGSSGGDPSTSESGSETSGGGAAWSVEYTGALSGNASGGAFTAQRLDTLMEVALAGDASGTDAGFSAGYTWAATDSRTGQHMLRSFNLTLSDGTMCSQDLMNGIGVMIDVLEDDGESVYSAALAGSLDCGGAQIEITGTAEE
jgi:hypothetical protein